MANRHPWYRHQVYLISAVLALVGAGNLAIGYSKHEYYQEALHNAAAKPVRNQGVEKAFDTDSIYIRRLLSRLHYYKFVFRGGACIILLAFVILAYQLWRGSGSEESMTS